MHLRALFILCVLSLIACQSPKISTNVDADGFQSLIGEELGTDWIPKFAKHPVGKNYKNTFRIQDGILEANYDQYEVFDEEFGHLFYKTPYSSYILKCDYRFLGEQVPGAPGWAVRNSGVMLHCQDPNSMPENQDFPMSLECQFLGGLEEGTSRPTGSLCTPGCNVVMGDSLEVRHCVTSSAKTYYGDQWVNMECRVYADSLIEHYINGDLVMTYSKPTMDYRNVNHFDSTAIVPGTPIKSGYISFQAEGHHVQFRDIKIKDLSKK